MKIGRGSFFFFISQNFQMGSLKLYVPISMFCHSYFIADGYVICSNLLALGRAISKIDLKKKKNREIKKGTATNKKKKKKKKKKKNVPLIQKRKKKENRQIHQTN